MTSEVLTDHHAAHEDIQATAWPKVKSLFYGYSPVRLQTKFTAHLANHLLNRIVMPIYEKLIRENI